MMFGNVVGESVVLIMRPLSEDLSKIAPRSQWIQGSGSGLQQHGKIIDTEDLFNVLDRSVIPKILPGCW